MPDFPVHPYAAAFPLLSENKLLELAANISAIGQRTPIMLDHAGEMLLDGRNRLRACAIAGVEPRIERLDEGIDPIDFIVSANVEHRHLNKGQQAVALAMAYPEKHQGKRASFNLKEVNSRDLSHAREIVAHADLAEQVMSEALAFDRALGEARWRVTNAATAKQHQRRLQNEAPDLAEAVTAGQMSLYEAAMKLIARQKAASADHKKAREAVVEGLRTVAAGWKNGLDLRQDEAFRAALIRDLGIEPADIKAALAGIDRFVNTTS